MYLISVYFDETSNKIMNRYIQKIANKTGNTFMLEHKVPPHLTISAIEAKSVDVLMEPFETLRGTVESGQIHVVSIGRLLPYVFYAAPTVNDYLISLHQTVYEAMKDIPETTISKYYHPNNLYPHITLGKTLDKEQMRLAFLAMQEDFQPQKVQVTEIGLARVNPHTDVIRFSL